VIKIHQKALRKILLLIILLSAIALQTNFFIEESPVTAYSVAVDNTYYPTPGNIPPEKYEATEYNIDNEG
jgi:hypothetical protein